MTLRQQICGLLAEGLSPQEIADRTGYGIRYIRAMRPSHFKRQATPKVDDPTEEEIKQRTEEIRAAWDVADRRRRELPEIQRVRIPVVRVRDIAF
jgi:hypothetical protein